MKITLPTQGLSTNDMYRNKANGQVYRTEAYKRFEMFVKCCVGPARWRSPGLIKARVYLIGNWFSKKDEPLRKDSDNFGTKPLFDALSKALGFDDKRIFQFTVAKIQSKTKQAIVVSLIPAPSDPETYNISNFPELATL